MSKELLNFALDGNAVEFKKSFKAKMSDMYTQELGGIEQALFSEDEVQDEDTPIVPDDTPEE